MKRLFAIFLGLFLLLGCQEQVAPIEVPEASFSDRLLYSKNVDGHNAIYLLANSQETFILGDEDYDYWWPKVHPDKSEFLVYRSPVNPQKNHDDYEKATLMLVDIDGNNERELINLSDYNWESQGVCRWNKDGSKIIMCAELEAGGNVQWRLIATDALGQSPEVLSHYWAIDCNISDDNSSIVFMGFRDNQLNFDLTKLELLQGNYDASLDTVTNIVALTDNTTRDHDPAFSPDNQKIVFSGGNSAYSDVDLVLYDFNTQESQTLLDDERANGGSMCWTQDGAGVVYHSLDVFKSPFEIRHINITTKEVTTLLRSPNGAFGYFHPEMF